MAYSRSSIRRSRRQRRFWVILLIAVIVGVAALAVSYRTERREVADYLDVAKQVADGQDDVALSLSELFDSLGDNERNAVLDSLDNLAGGTAELDAMLGGVAVPRPVGEANGFLAVATAAWRDAVASLDEAFVLILDDPDDRSGEALLEEAFTLLEVGDRAYSGFTSAVAALDTDIVTREYPVVQYVGEERAGLYDASKVAERLRALQVLSQRHDVSISAQLQPAPSGQRNEFPVIPWTDQVRLEAVLTNTGNETEFGIPVRLQIAAIQDPEGAVTLEQTVALLDPDEATTLTFDNLDIVPGLIYEVAVSAVVPDDADTTNDSWNLVFIRNDAS